VAVGAKRPGVKQQKKESPNPVVELTNATESPTHATEVTSPSPVGEPTNAAKSPGHDGKYVNDYVDVMALESGG
ncbi:hypothetical protein KI387_029263, partial [Taxus chinensis]